MSAITSQSRYLRLLVLAGLGVTPVVTEAAVAQAGADAGPQRVGVIDVQRLVMESRTGRDVLERLKNLREQKMAESEALQQEIDALRGSVQEGRMSLSEDKLGDLEKQIEEKMIQLKRFNDDAERSLQKEQQAEFGRIEGQIMPIIASVGQEQGFTLIFNKFNSGLLFAVETVDITDLILQRYDSSVQEDG